jgi:hypothetical protein
MTMLAMKLQQQERQITTSKTRRRAIAKGYRSGLEEKISQQIEDAGLKVEYETDKVKYIWPEREATYTPDFKLPSDGGGFFFVETKGLWTTEDRQKWHLVTQQHPDKDFRLVFSNQNSRLYKGSPTTYAAYCDKHGFTYANKTIPEEWLTEGVNDNAKSDTEDTQSHD